MELTEHYTTLYKEAVRKISDNTYDIDQLIDSPSDKRLGITLIIRPSSEVKDNILEFLDEMRIIDPNQYYYPKSDIHITVLSIISCYNGFNLSQINVSEYREIIKKSIASMQCFNVEFKGVTASSSCIMIQGFPENNIINDIRNNLRILLKESNLEHAVDKRYEISTAHSTVVRFRENLIDVKGSLKLLEKYINFSFGSFEVNSLEFVFNDWYLRTNNCRKLKEYYLPSKKIVT